MDLTAIVKLLPIFDEISALDDDAETNYIFKFACDALRNSPGECEEASFLVQCLVDRSWERINTGQFSNVPTATRKVYAVANFLKIVFLLSDSVEESQLEKCIQVLDSAILVGVTDDLYAKSREFIGEITSYLNKALKVDTEHPLPLVEPLLYEDNAECDIAQISCPSVDLFAENHFKQLQPVLLKDTIKHWPALTKWRDLNYLLSVAGNRTVPIELGSNYTTDDWSQEMMKFKDFLARQFGPTDSPSGVEYLAQHELFDQIPALKDDIRIPDYCCVSNGDRLEVDIKGWLGPKGTISPMHYDPKHNLLCQVFGAKKIILVSPADSEYVYPHQSDMLGNTSQIDAECIDFGEFPLARRAKLFHLKLQEGDVLYLPPKWWHFVKALSKSFSVSFWWE